MTFLDTPGNRRSNLIRLTPLIDVVFILLVFFMLASSFLDWRVIPMTVAAPSSAPTKTTGQPPLIISISETETRFNGELMALGAILPLLHQRIAADPQTVVRVKSLADTSLQTVIGILDQLRTNGVERVTMIRDRDWGGEPEKTAGS